MNLTNISHDEARQIAIEAAHEAAEHALEELFVKLGVNIRDPEAVLRFQRNLSYLDRWKRAMDTINTLGIGVVVTTFVAGALATLWLGLKQMLAK